MALPVQPDHHVPGIRSVRSVLIMLGPACPADCPSAPGCEMPAPGPPPSEDTCRVGAMRCWDFTLLMAYLVLLMTAAAGLFVHVRKHTAAAGAAGAAEDTEQLHERLLGAARRKVGAAIGADGGSSSSSPSDSSEGEEEIETLQGVRYPWLERQLQGFYRRHVGGPRMGAACCGLHCPTPSLTCWSRG
jgi:hypothetical protein